MDSQTRKEELKVLLKRLNSGEESAAVRKEAGVLLQEINPRELSEAEQELVEEGLPETELRSLCTVHIEVMAEELKALKTDLPAGHPLHTLIAEHDEILGFLDRLEAANQTVQEMKEYEPEHPVFAELEELAHHLIETEKHHEREEETIFPRLEKEGITGPPNIMRMEHDDLWPRKERLDQVLAEVENMEFAAFKNELDETAKYLTLQLRDHIFKENNILYPTAQETIAGQEWETVKRECDEIGYCCFTPDK